MESICATMSATTIKIQLMVDSAFVNMFIPSSSVSNFLSSAVTSTLFPSSIFYLIIFETSLKENSDLRMRTNQFRDFPLVRSNLVLKFQHSNHFIQVLNRLYMSV